MRRLAAAVLALLLANVNVARALSCDRTPEAVAQHQSMPSSGHEHHAPASAPETHKAPGVPQCCQAMTSCVAIADLAVERETGDVVQRACNASGSVLSAPVRGTFGPEPPPPKV